LKTVEALTDRVAIDEPIAATLDEVARSLDATIRTEVLV